MIRALPVRKAVPCGAEPAIDFASGEIATFVRTWSTVASDATDLAACS